MGSDDNPARDWEVAARLAATWVDHRCQSEGAIGVLVTNTMGYLGVEALDDFAQRHVRTSRRAGRHPVGAGPGPVLAYVPHEEELEFAMNLARGSSLAVVETATFPLLGWASWFEAWDVVRDRPTPPLQESIKDIVERLAFYGNNGFGDDFGKQRAQSILEQLGETTRQASHLLPGAVIAAGVSSRAARNLGRLIDRAHLTLAR